MIDMARQEVTRHNLNAAWQKLWPDVVAPRDVEGFKMEDEIEPEIDEIILLGKDMGLEVNDEDINELIQEHKEELSMTELKELEAMQRQCRRSSERTRTRRRQTLFHQPK